jgi:hypothetical protein
MQDVAWGYLATGSAALRQQLLPRLLRVPGANALLHPTLQRCPSYHKGHSYAAGVLTEHSDWSQTLPGAYTLHLVVSEMWDLWPWQLEMLQQQQQQEQQQQQQQEQQQQQQQQDSHLLDHDAQRQTAASNTHDAVANSHRSRWVTMLGPAGAFWPLLPHVMSSVLQSIDSNSGSSSSGSGSRDSSIASRTNVSSSAAAETSCQLPPVSADQLHLALERVCLNVQLSTYPGGLSLLLLVLLLLRAEPALRLAFLQGPQGGLLLAALQLYGCGRTALHDAVEEMEPGMAAEGTNGWLCSKDVGLEGVRSLLFPASTYNILPQTSTAGLALSWLLLQAQGIPEGGSRSSRSSGGSGSSSGSSSSSSAASAISQTGIAWSPGPLMRFGTTEDGLGRSRRVAAHVLPHVIPGTTCVASRTSLWVHLLHALAFIASLSAAQPSCTLLVD